MGTWLQIAKETVTTQDVLDRYLGRPDRYNRGKYLCPFHADKKTPSLSINQKTGRFKCFGCGASGDAIDFMQMYFSVDQKRALEILNDDFGLRFENCKKDTDARIEQIRIKRQREELKQERLENLIRFFKTRIHLAMWVATDIYVKNGPERNNDMGAFRENEKRVQKCMWSTYQTEYLLWLEKCLDETAYFGDNDYPGFQFDIGILGELPVMYERNIHPQWKENLNKRKLSVLEKLKTGEIGIYARKYY